MKIMKKITKILLLIGLLLALVSVSLVNAQVDPDSVFYGDTDDEPITLPCIRDTFAVDSDYTITDINNEIRHYDDIIDVYSINGTKLKSVYNEYNHNNLRDGTYVIIRKRNNTINTRSMVVEKVIIRK